MEQIIHFLSTIPVLIPQAMHGNLYAIIILGMVASAGFCVFMVLLGIWYTITGRWLAAVGCFTVAFFVFKIVFWGNNDKDKEKTVKTSNYY